MLSNIVKEFSPFSLKYLNIDAFPDFKRPRVIVLKLAKSPKLGELKRLIENGLGKLGIESDAREFIPHITIGRVKKGFGIRETAAKFTGDSFLVENIALVSSKLGKGGSEYINLGVYKLS